MICWNRDTDDLRHAHYAYLFITEWLSSLVVCWDAYIIQWKTQPLLLYIGNEEPYLCHQTCCTCQSEIGTSGQEEWQPAVLFVSIISRSLSFWYTHAPLTLASSSRLFCSALAFAFSCWACEVTFHPTGNRPHPLTCLSSSLSFWMVSLPTTFTTVPSSLSSMRTPRFPNFRSLRSSHTLNRSPSEHFHHNNIVTITILGTDL